MVVEEGSHAAGEGSRVAEEGIQVAEEGSRRVSAGEAVTAAIAAYNTEADCIDHREGTAGEGVPGQEASKVPVEELRGQASQPPQPSLPSPLLPLARQRESILP